jgi:hypothetical protein
MTYCAHCNCYFNKLNSKKCCNSCSLELSGSPPSTNNFLLQYEAKIKKEITNETIQNNYRLSATLQDLAADELIHNLEALKVLGNYLPEGHPPWHTLIKAWQRHKKIKTRSSHNPKAKLFRLLGHPISNIQ